MDEGFPGLTPQLSGGVERLAQWFATETIARYIGESLSEWRGVRITLHLPGIDILRHADLRPLDLFVRGHCCIGCRRRHQRDSHDETTPSFSFPRSSRLGLRRVPVPA